MEYPKEFTSQEYKAFIEKNEFESFTKAMVDAFSRDVLEKSQKQEVDEFEVSCALADYASLHQVTVVNEDLTKSIMYWREAQTEAVEIPEGIFKSIDDRACRRYKDTPLNILKGIAGINCADVEAISKSRMSKPVGSLKIWKGREYIKTLKGWRPKHVKDDSEEAENEGDKKKTSNSKESHKKE